MDTIEEQEPVGLSRHKSELFHTEGGRGRVGGWYTDSDERLEHDRFQEVRLEAAHDPYARLSQVSIRHVRLLGVRDQAFHVHYLSSRGHVQDGAEERSHRCRRSKAQSVRGEGIESGGRIHHAGDREREPERADNHDWREGERYGEGGLDALGRGENGFVTVDGISFIYIYIYECCVFV